jgi:hypothetical protein
MSGITRDEWLRAMQEAGIDDCVSNDEDAITVVEFQEMMGVGRSSALARLRALVKAGKATPAIRRAKDRTGRSISVPAYKLLTSPKKKR